jgi:hypothetical protein
MTTTKKKKSRRTVCLRTGCKNKLPELAVAHGDSFCSSACARQHHGLVEREKLT